MTAQASTEEMDRSRFAQRLGAALPAGHPATHLHEMFTSGWVVEGRRQFGLFQRNAGFCRRLEVYFIDESFLALDGLAGLWPGMSDVGQAIRHEVLTCGGVPVCGASVRRRKATGPREGNNLRRPWTTSA